jgi:GntR family transcriptional regulator / MocR family aminotransferase
MPLYRQIYEAISRGILDGRFAPGARLPSSRRLAADLGVSRITVMNAYDQLLAEGYIEGRHGSGTFVASKLPEEFLRVKKGEKHASGENNNRTINFSDYGNYLKNSAGRIVDHHSRSTIAAFQHSLPAMREFPFDVWSKIVQQKLKYPSQSLSGYGEAMGYRPLRTAVAEHLRSTRGVDCDDEQVFITAGTQQAIYLISRILLSVNDTVWLEDPCHLGARDIFEAAAARIVSVPVNEEGFDLEAAKKLSPPARIVYVTPSHQFPLGITMSLERRLNLLEWAGANNAWIVEDDYDSEFRYAARPLPALQGLDRGARVLYLGTFSKTVFPGLRLGCIVVPPDLVEVLAAARALTDLHGPIIDQMVLAEFITEGHFERHVRRMRTLYSERQAILVEQAGKYLSGCLEVARADAGMHLIGWLPEGVDDRAVSQRAKESGIWAAPLSRYSNTRAGRGGLLLGYTAFDEREIKTGVKALTKSFNRH